MTNVDQQNAIDEAVSQIQGLVDGLELPCSDGGNTYTILSADDLDHDRVEALVRVACERYCEEFTRQPDVKARATDPRTSRAAAAANSKIRKGQQQRIVALLSEHPSWQASAEAIADDLGMRLNSVSTRMSELVRGGWVDCYDTGGRVGVYQVSTKGLLHYRIHRQASAHA